MNERPQKRPNGKRFAKLVKKELHKSKASFFVYSSLRFLIILTLVRQFMLGNYESCFLCVLTLILILLPSIVQVRFQIELPRTLEIIIMLFAFSAEILGEINEFYILIPAWDTVLHTLNGFLAAAIGYSAVTLLNDGENVQFRLSPMFAALVAFTFSVAGFLYSKNKGKGKFVRNFILRKKCRMIEQETVSRDLSVTGKVILAEHTIRSRK